MPSIVVRMLLFLSSYLPLLVIFSILFFRTQPIFASACIAVGAFGVIALLIYLHQVSTLGPQIIRVAKIQRHDSEAMAYLFTYVTPFAAFSSNDSQQRVALAVFFVVLAVLYVHSNMIHINPILNVLRYHVFEIEDDEGDSLTIISRKRLRRNSEVNGLRVGDTLFVQKENLDG